MILRPATPQDLPALARLAREAFIAKFGVLYSAENLAMFLEDSLSEQVFAADLTVETE